MNKQLTEFFNDNIKIKIKEKKEHGEVFTPLSLVNILLDKLDQAYILDHGKSIFCESNLKWFDPAVGIGNFIIVIYSRLMNGLTQIIRLYLCLKRIFGRILLLKKSRNQML